MNRSENKSFIVILKDFNEIDYFLFTGIFGFW